MARCNQLLYSVVVIGLGSTRRPVTGDNLGACGAITEIDLNYLSAVGTFQFNDARCGGHFIKDTPITIGASLDDFYFIRVMLHSVRSSSSMSIRTKA